MKQTRTSTHQKTKPMEHANKCPVGDQADSALQGEGRIRKRCAQSGFDWELRNSRISKLGGTLSSGPTLLFSRWRNCEK